MRNKKYWYRKKHMRALSLWLGMTLIFQTGMPVAAAPAGVTYEEYRAGSQAERDGDYVTVSVSTEADLLQLAQACQLDSWSRDKLVKLENDIELRQCSDLMIPSFGGIFEGNGHKLSGLKLEGAGSAVGLFRYLQEGAKVRNLAVQGRVEPVGTRSQVGGIVGVNYGSISNCSFAGIVGGDTEVGGIAGSNMEQGDIRRCEAYAVVSGNHSTGGIAGNNQGIISMCKNRGDINTFSEEVSYDLEDITAERLEDINSTSNVTAHTDSGGIAGISDGKIYACVNYGTVGYSHVGYNVGGIVGRLSQGYLSDCVNEGHVLGRKDVGGIAGQMEPFLEIQYLMDKLQELDRETDKLFDLMDATRTDLDHYGTQAADLTKDMTGHLRDAMTAGGNLLSIAEELWYIYNQELTGIHKDVQKMFPSGEPLEPPVESAPDTPTNPVPSVPTDTALSTLANPTPSVMRTAYVATAVDRKENEVQDKAESESESGENADDSDRGEDGAGIGGDDRDAEVGKESEGNESQSETEGSGSAGQDADSNGGGENQEGTDGNHNNGGNSGNKGNSGSGSSGNLNLGNLATKDDLESYFAALRKFGVSIGKHMQKMAEAGSDRSGGISDNLSQFNIELQLTGEKLDQLTEVLDAGGEVASSDVDAVVLQIKVVRNLVKEIRDDLFAYEGITVEDASDEPAGENAGTLLEDEGKLSAAVDYDTESFQKGKIERCRNEAVIEADTCVGGIVGQVAIEFDLDPENDLHYTGEESFNIERKVKAVVRDSLNQGEVLGKRDYVGGIVGRADFGAIIACETYGNVSSSGGSKVGGIAGASDYAIRSCYSMGKLSGKNQVGGIVGKGCDVFYSYAYNQLELSGESGGSIAGLLSDEGTLYGNYYVQNSWGGVDGIGYRNGATPLSYDEFRTLQEVPDSFYQFHVTFRVNEQELAVLECGYGEALDRELIPDIPEKEGYYGVWPEFDFGYITDNEVLEAEYERWQGSLAGETVDEVGKSRVLVEGEFLPGAKLEVVEQEDVTRISITQPVLYKGQIQEQRTDYRQPVTVRVLCEEAKRAAVEVEHNGGYEPVDVQVMGSYVIFSMEEPGAFRVTIQSNHVIIYVITAVVVVLVLGLAILLITRSRKKRAGKAAAKTEIGEESVGGTDSGSSI
ncbi:MAG: hypothetical protein K2O32_05695 [Acetatifactor sp.]|nr:hypothetical protein [Acetatifactor sp.]